MTSEIETIALIALIVANAGFLITVKRWMNVVNAQLDGHYELIRLIMDELKIKRK